MKLVSPSEALLRLLRRVFGRERIPAGLGTGDINGPFGFRPDVADGGASVREPRRPKPAPPHMQAEAEEPPPETFLDLGPVR